MGKKCQVSGICCIFLGSESGIRNPLAIYEQLESLQCEIWQHQIIAFRIPDSEPQLFHIYTNNLRLVQIVGIPANNINTPDIITSKGAPLFGR